jgi:hypothetical protein
VTCNRRGASSRDRAEWRRTPMLYRRDGNPRPPTDSAR